MFRWILVRIPLYCFLSLEGGFFLNRGELSMALKAILVPHSVYGNISPGGVLYTPRY